MDYFVENEKLRQIEKSDFTPICRFSSHFYVRFRNPNDEMPCLGIEMEMFCVLETFWNIPPAPQGPLS
jgi:hypothetical protein